jgi:hypothetical protein
VFRADRLGTGGFKNRWGHPVMNPKRLISSFGRERDPKPDQNSVPNPHPRAPRRLCKRKAEPSGIKSARFNRKTLQE